MDIMPKSDQHCPRCESWMVLTSSGNPYCLQCDQVWVLSETGLTEAPPSPLRVTPEVEQQLAEHSVFLETLVFSPDGRVTPVPEVKH